MSPQVQKTYVLDDGGREAAGFKGSTRDCATRAVAIATPLTYREAYDALNQAAAHDKPSRRSNARTGVYRETLHRYLTETWGARWVSWSGIGREPHYLTDMPTNGIFIARMRRHFVAVVNGEVRDTFNTHTVGGGIVYGYWIISVDGEVAKQDSGVPQTEEAS